MTELLEKLYDYESLIIRKAEQRGKYDAFELCAVEICWEYFGTQRNKQTKKSILY